MIKNGVRRGDVFYVKTEYYVEGKKMSKGRPAIIISNNFHNAFSTSITVVYLTTKYKKPLPTHVYIDCKQPSTAMCENIQTISKERLGYYVKTCDYKEMRKIEQALCCFLSIDTFAFVIHNVGFMIKRFIEKLRNEFKLED